MLWLMCWCLCDVGLQIWRTMTTKSLATMMRKNKLSRIPMVAWTLLEPAGMLKKGTRPSVSFAVDMCYSSSNDSRHWSVLCCYLGNRKSIWRVKILFHRLYILIGRWSKPSITLENFTSRTKTESMSTNRVKSNVSALSKGIWPYDKSLASVSLWNLAHWVKQITQVACKISFMWVSVSVC